MYVHAMHKIESVSISSGSQSGNSLIQFHTVYLPNVFVLSSFIEYVRN